MSQTAIKPYLTQYLVFFSIFVLSLFTADESSAFSSSCSRLHTQDDGVRGTYYNKKAPANSPIPHFENSISQLPSPILDSHSEWIDLYWATWKLAFQHFKAPPPSSPLVSNYIDAAFSDHLFQWDTIFMMQFANYANAVFPAIGSLDNFYSRQHADGYIDREIVAASGADFCYLEADNMINPPLFAWAEVRYAHFTGDTSRFSQVYSALLHYAQYLERARKASSTGHQLYWNTALGSGMDNSPRDLNAESGWVDMSSQIVLMYQSLSEIALTLGKNADAQQLGLAAQGIADRIQKFMWNDQEGFYFDVDPRGMQKEIKTAAGFWPLLAHIPNTQQVEKLVAQLRNPKTFWRTNIWPSLAADESKYSANGNYWQGGVWAPLNSMIIEGLKKYPEVAGTNELIEESSEKYLRNMSDVFTKTGTVWELYKPDSPAPGYKWGFIPGRPDFVGWSGIGPIQFLIENIIGIQGDPFQHKIRWRIQNTAHQGVNNLTVGNVHISLELAPRKSQESPLVITSRSDRPIDLEVKMDGKSFRHSIKTGLQHWTLTP